MPLPRLISATPCLAAALLCLATFLDPATRVYGAQKPAMKLLPVSIAEGMAAPPSLSKEEKAEYLERFHGDVLREAQQVGVDMTSRRNWFYALGVKAETLFLVFFNHVQASGCPTEFLIQRVKLTKAYYAEGESEPYEQSAEYLVEVMKLNDRGQTKGTGDRHSRNYHLGKAFRRTATVECEVGWGRIPGVAEGEQWPFPQRYLYQLVQNYSPQPGIYDRVQFAKSTTYVITIEFDRTGRYSVLLPSFIKTCPRPIRGKAS
jgi:hypothetical protein